MAEAIHPLVLIIAACTSVLAIVLGARGVELPLRRLGTALGVALETVGATVIFFVANVIVGSLLILVARRLTPYYLTLYEVTDVSLLVLSVLQAVTFQAWRSTR
jgi:hypothetical protein